MRASQRWQCRESGPEPLDAPAFLIDGHDERGLAHGVNIGHQVRELRGIGVVASKEDDAAHQRMAQHFAVLGRQLETGHIDHQWPKGHNLLPV